MNVLMLNTFDNVAGADRAARRLQLGLRHLGVEAALLVQFCSSPGEGILCDPSPVRRQLRRLKLFAGTLPVLRYPLRPVANFTPAILPDRLSAQVARLDPDLVHLHWLGAGFCRIESLVHFQRPLIWTMHDSWPFTGGCHTPGTCRRYQERCGACPVLGSRHEDDLSRRVWQRKTRAWRGLSLTVVAPSRWLADCARSSSLFEDRRIVTIPNGIDTERFRPQEQQAARARLGLPQERPLVLFGAVNALQDRNKGWDLLQPALRLVGERSPQTLAVVFGASAPPDGGKTGLETLFLGRLDDDATLRDAYAAADVFVAPSRQEAFCQTILEAQSCGTPAVAFAATGPLDLIDHCQTGYLAEPYQADDLARGLLWVLEDRPRRQALGEAARNKALRDFAIGMVAQRYRELYAEMLEPKSQGER